MTPERTTAQVRVGQTWRLDGWCYTVVKDEGPDNFQRWVVLRSDGTRLPASAHFFKNATEVEPRRSEALDADGNVAEVWPHESWHPVRGPVKEAPE